MTSTHYSINTDEFSLINNESSYDKSSVCKVTLIAVSIILGGLVAYAGTLPEWDQTKFIITNIGVLTAFWVIASWGLNMFGNRVIDKAKEVKELSHSCGYTSMKVVQAGAAFFGGLLAQVPYASMGAQFHGAGWGWFTEVSGSFPISYSLYSAIDEIEKQVYTNPALRFEGKKKSQLTVAQEVAMMSKNILRNYHLATHAERQELLNTMIENHNASDVDRLTAMFNHINDTKASLLEYPEPRPSCLTCTRRVIQILPTLFGSLYLFQLYLLAKDGWDQLTDNEDLNKILSTPAILFNLYYVSKACYDGIGHLFDMGCDALGVERPTSINERYYPKLSRSLYLLGGLFAILPQFQTYYICNEYYKASTPFGGVFAAGSIVGFSLYIYTAMRELTDSILSQCHHMGSEELQVVSKLREEVEQNILRIQNFSYEDLAEMCNALPSDIKNNLLTNVDFEEFNSHVRLAKDNING